MLKCPARTWLMLAVSLSLACANQESRPDPEVPTAPSLGGGDVGDDHSGGDHFQVKFETSKGDFVIEIHPHWAPLGAERFRELVKVGFFDECRFFRAVEGFVVQFGINGDPSVQAKWRDNNIMDDQLVQSNKRGFLTFAKSGPNSRSSQLFVNLSDNANLDSMGFPPIGKVIEGMDVVDALTTEYDEQPDQRQIQHEGNEYLNREFPNLDYIISARIVGGDGPHHDE